MSRHGQLQESNPFPLGARLQIPGLAFSHSLLEFLHHLLQAGLVQYTEGTQRLEEPVSKMTVKFCGGVPMEMVPKYSICRPGREGSRLWVLWRGRDLEGALWAGAGLAQIGIERPGKWPSEVDGRGRQRGRKSNHYPAPPFPPRGPHIQVP